MISGVPSFPLYKNWVESFSEEELQAQGWSNSQLLELWNQSPSSVHLLQGEALVSLIFYQRVDQDTREILFLATRPEARGQGQMRGLLLEFLATEPGKVWLECREDNLAALGLYQASGFRPVGRRPGYYKDGTAAILLNY